MAYRFKLDEKVSDGFRRIARHQIERGEAGLRGPADPERVVHETRKCIKRLRALLRLLHPGIAQKTFKRENARLRDIAALFSETRDHHVIEKTIAALGAAKPDTPLFNLKRLALMKSSSHFATEDPGRTAAAIAGFKAALARFEKLRIKSAGFATLRSGAQRTYAQAHRAMKEAYATDDCEAFHELRKHIQQHWRQMQLLSRAWPEIMEARASAARELSELLGEDHDLAVLAVFVKQAPRSELGKREAREIMRSIRDRQSELRALARPRLERLLAGTPRSFGRHLKTWWMASRRFEAPPAAQAAPEAPAAGKLPAAGEPAPAAAATEPRAGRAA